MSSTLRDSQQSHRPIPDLVSTDEEADFQPPNGGIYAYFKVTGCFIVFFMTLGLSSSFGSYQAYYEETMLPSYSPSVISWIGTTQVFLLSFIGTFSGAVYDRGYVREVLLVGMGLVILGLCMLSLAHEYWQVILTQGICVGIGSGLLFVPAVSIVSNHFTTKRPSALGISAAGSAIGGVVWPIMFRKLLPLIGFAWVNRALGLVTLLLAALAFYFLTSHQFPPPGHRQRRADHPHLSLENLHPHGNSSGASRPISQFVPQGFSVGFNGRAYLFLCIGVFFIYLGYWIPLFYVVPFASLSLGTPSTYASYLLSILNAGSLFGRILPAYLGQTFGSANVLFLGTIMLGVLVFVWMSIASVPAITVWCFLVGFMSGIVVTIPNAVASRLSKPSNTGLRIGIMWTAGAFAELIGTPIAGSLITRSDDGVSYVGGQIFGGLSILLGAMFLIVPAWSILKDDKLRQARNA